MFVQTNDLAGQEKQNTLKSERWVVQKLGGTSLGHFATNIAKDIIRPGAQEHRVAVVCSAISRSTKENGTTNRLFLACSELQTDGASFSRFIDGMQLEHVQAAMRDIQSLSIREELIKRIRYECASVIKTLNAAYFLGEVGPACVGRVVSAGERLSCHYLVAILQDIGLQASFVDVSNLNLALSSPIDWNDEAFVGRVATEVSEKILSVSGIPIITGYFELQPAGALLAHVGRGYTDLCAALVATGLEATQLQIWKEFDGVFTADPHHVPDATLLSHLTLSELKGLTSYGSQVVHTAAVDVARDQNLMLSVRNVSKPLNPGTLVTQGVGDPETQFMAITIKRYIATLNLRNLQHYSGFGNPSEVSFEWGNSYNKRIWTLNGCLSSRK
ncbi:uncharacterized protein BO66DRAFT_460792 [Aspergillus aculeatinus CBS 121060]|uniref:Uncharacterized protein n=1 Tax=Aspergillus aculeatinus CBS 121060 TaxID=1448322 RepID=A0ACD1GX04_9EURO|nr:hypothetical protein BO66DRAFT_460792 [Aspergillus aculeatinus CBS 121060]RAH65875.1 hypothetical protein BO66DRAFT_460792 [Aspergillus aculeatinus CBS 121060]